MMKNLYLHYMNGYLINKTDLFKKVINSFEFSRKEIKMLKYVRHNKGLYNWKNFCDWFKDENPFYSLHEFLFGTK